MQLKNRNSVGDRCSELGIFHGHDGLPFALIGKYAWYKAVLRAFGAFFAGENCRTPRNFTLTGADNEHRRCHGIDGGGSEREPGHGQEGA